MRPPLFARSLLLFLSGAIATTLIPSPAFAQEVTSTTQTHPVAQPAATETLVAEREMVHIDGQDFIVPKPWAGNRVAVPADTVANLQLIPPDLTYNQTIIHLRNEAIEPLKAMAAAARKDDIVLLVDSGYRSIRYQRQIVRQFLEKGRTFKQISRYIAPPGYSEHALGTVVDFAPSNQEFARSKAYAWLKRHAETFGFHETMPRTRRGGVPWEPWHWKYRPPVEGGAPLTLMPTMKKKAPPEKTSATTSLPALTPQISIKPVLIVDPARRPR